jgi:hypothetical protein
MSQEGDAVLARLKEASKGLTFQSEADYPVEPFLIGESPAGPITPALLLKAMGHKSSTPVKTEELRRFFEPATLEQDWHNDTERETVRRFQNLVKVLTENLDAVQVFKLGKTESDVYVVGRTRSGDLAGVKTRVVET